MAAGAAHLGSDGAGGGEGVERSAAALTPRRTRHGDAAAAAAAGAGGRHAGLPPGRAGRDSGGREGGDRGQDGGVRGVAHPVRGGERGVGGVVALVDGRGGRAPRPGRGAAAPGSRAAFAARRRPPPSPAGGASTRTAKTTRGKSTSRIPCCTTATTSPARRPRPTACRARLSRGVAVEGLGGRPRRRSMGGRGEERGVEDCLAAFAGVGFLSRPPPAMQRQEVLVGGSRSRAVAARGLECALSVARG